MPMSDQEVFPRRWHGVHKFFRATRELPRKNDFICEWQAMASSTRPHRVATAIHTAFYRVSTEIQTGEPVIQSACRTLRFSLCLRGALSMRFHGVRTMLPRRSGTALTACRQNGNEVPVICTFCFQEISLVSALATVCENDHAENFWLPPAMTTPKAFFALCSICVFT